MKWLLAIKRGRAIGACSLPHPHEILLSSKQSRITVRDLGNIRNSPCVASSATKGHENIKEDSSSVSVPFRLSQEGKATLVAQVSQNATRLQVAHKSPCRWIPMTSQNSTSRSAMVALGHYGGGMADGDSATVDITVQDGAFLRCTTQGTNRIYKKRMGQVEGSPTRMKTIVRCGSNSTCWMTPDPTQLQKSARFHQKTLYELQDSSSLIAVDWVSAGRLTAGERWDHDLCRLRTMVSINGHVRFIDAQDLTPRFFGMDWKDVQLQTFGTVILYNVESEVIERFRQVQYDLCASYTAVRSGATTLSQIPLVEVLSGRVLLGMNSEDTSGVHVVRFAAESNEDVYRLLNWTVGKEHGAYAERIRAVQSASPVWVESDDEQIIEPKSKRKTMSFSASPGVLLMADSMFPIGSFAHSLGLESASQLGLIHSKQQVIHYLQAALLSNVQQSVPLIRYSTTNPSEWHAINAYAECLLSSNSPAYRASIEQAKNLGRIIAAVSNSFPNEVEEEIESLHFAPLWGRAAATTFAVGETEASYAFAYAIARDLVSAAVRMNLLGPMEGQSVLWNDLLPLLPEMGCMDHSLAPRLDDAATCAPSLEAIQPCHDLLATRLFRS